MEEEINNTREAINAGAALTEIKTIESTSFVVVPEGYEVKTLEHLKQQPTRRFGSVTLRDTASFIEFVNSEKGEASRIYGAYQPPGFVAVLNDHNRALGPGWKDHRAVYSCPVAWKAMDGKPMNQEQFAQFIENNLPDIANPPAAEMLEISRSLEAKKKVNFASGLRLSNGENQLTYEEQIEGTASKGQLKVPELFTIGIPVLEGGARYGVEARLRYRIADGGKLGMWYELVRPHKIIEDAVGEVWLQIQAETGITILNGSP